MRVTRRAFGTGLLAGLVGTTDCLDVVRDEEPLTFEAVGARPTDDALDETGYRHHVTRSEPVRETIEIAGQSREVELLNVLVECDKALELGPTGRLRAAAFVAFATPAFEVLGRQFHPGDRISTRRLATELSSNYDELSIGEEVDERTFTVFDEEVDVSTFEGRAVLGPTTLDVHVHLGSVMNDADFVVLAGIHPRRLEGEYGNVAVLAESLAATVE
jgi:hypothetical protein